jgi:hypothetical protein
MDQTRMWLFFGTLRGCISCPTLSEIQSSLWNWQANSNRHGCRFSARKLN